MVGIIPAGAGLTKIETQIDSLVGDHPRGCGAHQITTTRRPAVMGSSPRVRGSHSSPARVGARRGIIPAGAGLTRDLPPASRAGRDHPRGCGAHLLGVFFFHPRPGSSPRVRGSPILLDRHYQADGIIPAGAGLTMSPYPDKKEDEDHPRGCGAHKCFSAIVFLWQGSSPRVRGSQKPRGPRT